MADSRNISEFDLILIKLTYKPSNHHFSRADYEDTMRECRAQGYVSSTQMPPPANDWIWRVLLLCQGDMKALHRGILAVTAKDNATTNVETGFGSSEKAAMEGFDLFTASDISDLMDFWRIHSKLWAELTQYDVTPSNQRKLTPDIDYALSSHETRTGEVISGREKKALRSRSSAAEHSSAVRRFPVDDTLAPAQQFHNCTLDGAVLLRHRSADQPYESVVTWFNKSIDLNWSASAFKVKRTGNWETQTYGEYYQEVIRAAKSFFVLGLKPGSTIGIVGRNSPEWCISFYGAIYAGCTPVGIHVSTTKDSIRFLALDAKIRAFVVEDATNVEKIREVWGDLPLLKAVIQYVGVPEENTNVYTWPDFVEKGCAVLDAELLQQQHRIAPNKCCAIVYTSGTAACDQPKGALLTHDNLVWTSQTVAEQLKLTKDDVFISFLPLNHIMTLISDLFIPITTGGLLYFAPPETLKGDLFAVMRDARPTAMMAPPHVWEKTMQQMQNAMAGSGIVKRLTSQWAMDIGKLGYNARITRQTLPVGWTLANSLVFKKVQKALGLDRCRVIGSGAAPLSATVQEFFLSLNIPGTKIVRIQ